MAVNMWRRWLTEDDGQDIIEYALLGTFVGFAAIAGAEVLRQAMNATYASWTAAATSDALVEVPNPK
jgi:Flp pilus assembly pilin Flp